MALLDALVANSSHISSTILLAIASAILLSQCIYRLTLHPLSHIPGPFIASLTSLWLCYHSYIGDEATAIHKAHIKYGPYVRVSPRDVDVSDADAVGPVYVTKSGFLKAGNYENFDIDGHKTIFSTSDVEYRSPRAKAVLPMFSAKSIRENETALYGCVDKMVRKMKEEANTGMPVNILHLGRNMGMDVVCTHLFHDNFDDTSKKSDQFSISAFVDGFLAAGRFFYLPKIISIWLEWAIGILLPDELANEGVKIVHGFVDNLVSTTAKGAQNYPGRLSALELDKSEIISQCKDLIVAGTDSTGLNLATICRQLVLHPDKWEALRTEVLSNGQDGSPRKAVQELPYLAGVVKEGLRLSMANSTRLSRVVPKGGWTFKDTFFPAGSLVGLSAFELHTNAHAYDNPSSFQPERWLEGNITPEANKHFYAFGTGFRSCIARNLATTELSMATQRLAEVDALRGAKVCQDKIELYQWFNSRVKGQRIDLIWEKTDAA